MQQRPVPGFRVFHPGHLMDQIIERQRDRQTREVKCVLRGFTLDGLEREAYVKIGPSGRLVVIAVYLA